MTKEYQELMELAWCEALFSKDPNRKVGAIVTDKEGYILARGHNHLPFEDDEILYKRREKLKYIIHAELAALGDLGNTRDAYMIVVTSFPCIQCMKSIYAHAVPYVICPKPEMFSFWKKSWQQSKDFADKVGIEIIHV